MGDLFLVTGVGHSGTGWAARLFRELGHDCGHERWHNPDRYRGMRGPDSSWLAVPNLDQLPDGCRIVHLIRDPLLVARSLLRIRFLHDRNIANPYARFVTRHRPDIVAPREYLDRVIRHVARWDEPVLTHPHMRLRVEDTDAVPDVVEYATGARPDGIEAVLQQLGTRINTHVPQIPDTVTWADVLDRPEGREMAARAEKYGYPVGEET